MVTDTVNTIEEAKTLIYDRLLRDYKAELQIEKLDKGTVDTFVADHPKGALVVHYDGSNFSESLSSSIVLQDRNFRIAIFFQIRIEHGRSYLDQLVDRVINSLSGMKFKTVAKTGRVRMREDQFLLSEKEEEKKFNEHSLVTLIPAQYKQVNENI